MIDTGVGIPAEKFETIFDPFVQADASVTRQFGGTGSGLTIAPHRPALGGGIEVSSEIGKGSTFTVGSPPVPWRASSCSTPRPRTACAAPSGKRWRPALADRRRILVVEDGDTNRKLISLLLQRAGAVVAEAENGRPARTSP